MADIDQRIAEHQEQAEFRQMALQQGEQFQSYQRRKQAWRTVRVGEKTWQRVSLDGMPSASDGMTFKTVKVDGRWVRVPC